MKVLTASEMREVDLRTIKDLGISSLALMERAGVAVAEKTVELFRPSKVLVLCGPGNNGGDGLVAARELHNRGANVKALMVGPRGKLSPDCKRQLETAKKVGVPVEFRVGLTKGDLHASVVIDAIFGTGLGKDITGALAGSIAMLNSSGCPVVSADIASGVSADTGRVLGSAVAAAATVTFGAPKRGHLLHPGAGLTGKLFVADIGFPPAFFGRARCELLEKENMALLLPERPSHSHKGDYGHVLVVAGSRGKTGAAMMSSRACLETGAGLVTIGSPEHLTVSLQCAVTEEMLLPLPDTGQGALSIKALADILGFMADRGDVLAIGPGLGRAEDTRRLVRELLPRCPSPMVIDADALNALEGNPGILGGLKAPAIITPHPGEFARLAGGKAAQADPLGAASSFAGQTGVTVVLKGAPTIIADPEGETFINSTGNPGMAKAGTGDVLTGMLASLLAQGLSPLEAALLGVYLHGLAGDLAARKTGLRSLVASDIVLSLPEAFGSLEEVLSR